jgi:hypothetical protein
MPFSSHYIEGSDVMELSLISVLSYLIIASIPIYVIIEFKSYLRLQPIPGPLSAHFSKWWFFKYTAKGNIHTKIQEASEKYGTVHLHSAHRH